VFECGSRGDDQYGAWRDGMNKALRAVEKMPGGGGGFHKIRIFGKR
jgi:hypothetical protein